MNKLFTCLFFLISLSAGAKSISGKVMEVPEGDILMISVGDGVMYQVHLSDVDCPEKGQPYFDKAKNFTEKMVLGKEVKVEVSEDLGSSSVVGIVSLLRNDRVLNYELVEEGYAWHVQKGLSYNDHTETFLDLMDRAKEKERGLWKDGDAMAPWAYRRRQNMYEAKSSME